MGNDDTCFGYSFSFTPKKPRSIMLSTSFGVTDGFSYISCNHLSSFYLLLFFRLLCHVCLPYVDSLRYDFSLSYQNSVTSSLSCFRTRYYWLSSTIYKAIKPGKYCSTSLRVFNLLFILYNFCGIGNHVLINSSNFCISLQTLL